MIYENFDLSIYKNFSGRPWFGFDRGVIQEWAKTLEYVDYNFISICSLDEVIDLGRSPMSQDYPDDVRPAYEGCKGTKYSPGLIDLDKTLQIGNVDPDSPIVLYKYLGNEIVAYLASLPVEKKSVWIKCADNLEDLYQRLKDIERRETQYS